MNEPQGSGTQNQQGSENLNPELAGYPTTEALVKGYRESGAEAKRWRDRSEELERLVADRDLSASQAAENPRGTVKNRSARPEDRLSEYGVPVDALKEYVAGQLQEAFAPIAQGMTARTEILSRYPDYNKFEADVATFIQSDPKVNQSYQRMFAADPAGAFEYAFLKFGDSRRRSGGGEEPDTRQESAQAQIPSGRNGDSQRMPQGNSAEISRAWEQYQRTGTTDDARRYAKARLHNVITDDFLNG
jgi:hypothetical protein